MVGAVIIALGALEVFNMARVRNPLHSEEASGKLANVSVFKSWRNIQTVARHSSQRNPQTARQQTVRRVFADVAKAWASLTPAQAALWEAYAEAHPRPGRLTDSVRQPGFDVFCAASRAYKEKYGSFPPYPMPAFTGALVTNFIYASPVPGRVDLGWTIPVGYPAGQLFAIWQQGPYTSPARRLRVPEQRFVTYVVSPTSFWSNLSYQSGLYWWWGVQVLPAGALPSPVQWLSEPYPVT